jgi:hypothetical protein
VCLIACACWTGVCIREGNFSAALILTAAESVFAIQFFLCNEYFRRKLSSPEVLRTEESSSLAATDAWTVYPEPDPLHTVRSRR